MTKPTRDTYPSRPASLLEKIFVGGLVVIFGLIVLHAPLTVFAGSHLGHALIFKAWKELLMGGLLVLAVIIVTRRRQWRLFMRDPLIVACLALALLYAASIWYGHGFRPYAAGLLIDLRYILYAVLVYVAARFYPGMRPFFLKIGCLGACVVIGFGLLQFVLPKDFLSILGYSNATITPYTTVDSDESLPRLQSTLRGPNPLGAYTLVAALVAGTMSLRAGVSRRARIGLSVFAISALAVLAGSYSRSAYIGAVAGASVLAAVIIGRKGLVSRRVLIGIAAAVIIVTGAFFTLRGTPFYASVFEHDVVGSGPAVDSNAGHSQSVTRGIADIMTHPFGYGTGSTGSASLLSGDGYIVENQYLYVAHEAGWIALGLFLLIVGLLLKRAYDRRSDAVALGVFAGGIGLLVVGLFLPVFADDTVSIVWFGLAALIAGGAEREK